MAKVKPSISCPACGGSKEYDFDRGIYRCSECTGQRKPAPEVAEVPLADLERAFSQPPDPAAPAVLLQNCRGCGAQVEVPADGRVAECLFCGRKTQAPGSAPRAAGRQGRVPFRISRGDAVAAIGDYLGSLWFRPGLKSRLKEASVRQVYVPFWAFDVQVDTDWKGSAQVWQEPGCLGSLLGSEGRYARQGLQGQRRHRYDDWLVCASHGLCPQALRQLEPFRTEEARACDEEDPGLPVEVAAVSPRLAWTRAQRDIRRQEYQRSVHNAREQVGLASDDGVMLAGQVRFGEPTGKRLLLPLYVFTVRTLWGRAQIVVNGETGQVGSRIPYSLLKLVPTVLLALLLVGALGVATGGLSFAGLVALFVWGSWDRHRQRKRDEATFLQSR